VYELSLVAGVGAITPSKFCPGPRRFAEGNLVRDTAGNLYGSTWQGGTSGCGLSSNSHPPRALLDLLDLYNFTCSQGDHAGHTMVMDTSVTSTASGRAVASTIMAWLRIESGVRRGWTYTVLYNFTLAEGGGPQIGLVADASGNLTAQTDTRSSSFLQRRRHLDRERLSRFYCRRGF